MQQTSFPITTPRIKLSSIIDKGQILIVLIDKMIRECTIYSVEHPRGLTVGHHALVKYLCDQGIDDNPAFLYIYNFKNVLFDPKTKEMRWCLYEDDTTN